MSAPLQVRILSPNGGNWRHLGAVERGTRSACGRTFKADQVLIENPGSVDVTCMRCMATNDYARAVVSGQIADMRARA